MKEILFIFFLLYFIVNCDLTLKDYYDYERLYNSDKFDNRLDYRNDNIITFKCNDNKIDCSGHGTCSSDKSKCECNSTDITPKGSYLQYGYYQKSKTIALVLEGIIGFGFGHLYVENYTLFIAKFLFFFFACYFSFCIMIFIGAVNNSNVKAETYRYTKISIFVILPLMAIWYFVDIALYASGVYKDGRGIDLY